MSSGDGVSKENGVMWCRGGPCTRSFTLAICLLYRNVWCPALLHWLLLFLICTHMLRANTDGSAKTPAPFWFVKRFEHGEMGERLPWRGVEGPGDVCDMRTLKLTFSGLRIWDNCLGCTDFCSLCLRFLRGVWFWSLGAAAWCSDIKCDKDGAAENPEGGGLGRGSGKGRGRLLRLRLLCCVVVVLALLSGLAVSGDRFCKPGTKLKRSGLLFWCSWISSANEGLPPWPPTPGLSPTPATSTGLLAWQVLLRLPRGPGNDPASLESWRDRLLREQDRRLDVGLTEVRLPRLGGTLRPPEREKPGPRWRLWPRLEEPKLVREIFGPWAGLAHMRSCSAISWARELGPAVTQPVPELGVNAFFATENWLESLTSSASVRAKRSIRLYESPDPGCVCVCVEVKRVILTVLCGVERDKAPYLTRANCMQRESVWQGGGGGSGGRWLARHHKQPYKVEIRQREKKAICYSLGD